MSHSDTQQNIALEENVSRSSVIRITPESVKPEVLAMAEDFKAEIVEKAKRNIRDGLDEMHERMFSPAAKLAEVTGAVKISHDILQLQTGQATSIVQDQAAMLQSLVNYCKLHANGPRQLAAMVMFAEGSGIDESLRRKEAERILLESGEGE